MQPLSTNEWIIQSETANISKHKWYTLETLLHQIDGTECGSHSHSLWLPIILSAWVYPCPFVSKLLRHALTSIVRTSQDLYVPLTSAELTLWPLLHRKHLCKCSAISWWSETIFAARMWQNSNVNFACCSGCSNKKLWACCEKNRLYSIKFYSHLKLVLSFMQISLLVYFFICKCSMTSYTSSTYCIYFT